MITNLFAEFADVETVQSLKLSANTTNTAYYINCDATVAYNGVPDIGYDTLVFVRNSGAIWTHGAWYGAIDETLLEAISRSVNAINDRLLKVESQIREVTYQNSMLTNVINVLLNERNDE